MIYAIEKTNSFKRDYKLIKKRGYKIDLLREVITILADGGTLPAKCRDHELKGKYTGYHECHITPGSCQDFCALSIFTTWYKFS